MKEGRKVWGKGMELEKVYTVYNEMFHGSKVDVIYVTTPHNTHIRFMKKAIENGTHSSGEIHYFK